MLINTSIKDERKALFTIPDLCVNLVTKEFRNETELRILKNTLHLIYNLFGKLLNSGGNCVDLHTIKFRHLVCISNNFHFMSGLSNSLNLFDHLLILCLNR